MKRDAIIVALREAEKDIRSVSEKTSLRAKFLAERTRLQKLLNQMDGQPERSNEMNPNNSAYKKAAQ